MKITLDRTTARPELTSHTTAAGDALEVSFVSPTYGLDELIVTAKNGKKTVQGKVKGGEALDISALLFAGVIHISVSLVAGGNTAKRWQVDPIVVKEEEAVFQLVDFVDDILARVTELENKTQIIM